MMQALETGDLMLLRIVGNNPAMLEEVVATLEVISRKTSKITTKEEVDLINLELQNNINKLNYLLQALAAPQTRSFSVI